MAKIALDWAEGRDLHRFDYVFLVGLRHVIDNSSLQNIIKTQHKSLTAGQISDIHLNLILTGQFGHNVLLLLDGYDEYQRGKNLDIDSLVENGNGNCFIILTSRPHNFLSKKLLSEFDGEFEITGLSHESILKFAAKDLGKENKPEVLIETAREIGVQDLLRIPTFLLMASVSFKEKGTFPTKKSEMISMMAQLCMNRSALKHYNLTADAIPYLTEMLNRLGKLSWKSLQKNNKQILIDMVSALFHFSF